MNRLAAVIVLALYSVCRQSSAGSLSVAVKDANGGPVSDAVVYAEGGNSGSAKRQAVIDQRDKQFVPYVTAVQVGTAIVFPNKDNIRHHVYSFSSAKKFELPLYAGVPAAPVVFDKVGFVTLGCNIHDWMVAYVAVVPTPYFQVTGGDGRAVVKDLPAGHFTVQVWHPSLKASPETMAQNADLAQSAASSLSFTVELKPDFRANRAPEMSTGGYR